jgi:hypothetical protein
MQFTDAVAVAGKPRRTADGYLVAEARCVRSGIQLYAGDEVGKPDMKIVRVYRAPEQVSGAASLQTFSHAPITVDHPAELVTADNVKALAVGEVSTAAKWDGEWVQLPLILKDAAAIQSVEGGKRELSAGYTCELDFTPGVTADGQAFDAQQKNIRINHLALVDRARAGSQARIGDGAWGAGPIPATEDKPMTLKTVTVDGIPVEVTDQGAIVIATLQKRLDDANATSAKVLTDHAAALADKDKALAAKDAEIDKLKGQVLDATALDKLVAARADLVALAGAIAKDVKVAGLSDADIRKAVVTAKLGDAAVKDKPQAYIDVRFDILADDANKPTPADPFRNAAMGGIQTTNDAAPVAAAHKAMTDHLSAAWQNPNGKAA